MARWYRDPELARLTRFHLGPVSDEEVRAYFNARLISADSFAYAIPRASDGAHRDDHIQPARRGQRSVLYHITIGEPEAWGRGFGTETTGLMVAHAFGRLGVHRVALSVFAFNERAVRAYEKAGFMIEGRAREAVWRDGRFWDEIHMGILAAEWRELHAPQDRGAGDQPRTRNVSEPDEPAGEPGASGTSGTRATGAVARAEIRAMMASKGHSIDIAQAAGPRLLDRAFADGRTPPDAGAGPGGRATWRWCSAVRTIAEHWEARARRPRASSCEPSAAPSMTPEPGRGRSPP